MKLHMLRARAIGSTAHLSMSLPLLLAFSVSACGPDLSSERDALKGDASTTQTYQEWCTAWELKCPVDEPGKTAPLTAAQFQSLSIILNSALSSPSTFRLTRDELNDDLLKQAAVALKLDDVLQDVQARLDERQWQSGGLDQGALMSNHAVASQVRTEAGLVWNLEPVQRLSVTPGSIQFSGLGLAADAAKDNHVLQSLLAGEAGSFTFVLNDRSIVGLPQDFALESLLLASGLDITKMEGKTIGLPEVIQGGVPLVTWLNQSSRQVTLERAFFASSAGEFGTLFPKDGGGAALGNLMSRFERLNTSSDPARNLASVSLVKGATAKCDLNNGETKVKFGSEFGVKRVYQPKAGVLGLEFYGLEASAKKAFGLSIKLKRVELSEDKITILDVPLIGKVELKLDDLTNPDEPTTLVCGA